MAFEIPKQEGKLFVVTNDEEMSVVRASGPAVALRHVIGNTHQVRPATPDDIEWYLSSGGVIDVAGKKEVADPTDDGVDAPQTTDNAN